MTRVHLTALCVAIASVIGSTSGQAADNRRLPLPRDRGVQPFPNSEARKQPRQPNAGFSPSDSALAQGVMPDRVLPQFGQRVGNSLVTRLMPSIASRLPEPTGLRLGGRRGAVAGSDLPDPRDAFDLRLRNLEGERVR